MDETGHLVGGAGPQRSPGCCTRRGPAVENKQLRTELRRTSCTWWHGVRWSLIQVTTQTTYKEKTTQVSDWLNLLPLARCPPVRLKGTNSGNSRNSSVNLSPKLPITRALLHLSQNKVYTRVSPRPCSDWRVELPCHQSNDDQVDLILEIPHKTWVASRAELFKAVRLHPVVTALVVFFNVSAEHENCLSIGPSKPATGAASKGRRKLKRAKLRVNRILWMDASVIPSGVMCSYFDVWWMNLPFTTYHSATNDAAVE